MSYVNRPPRGQQRDKIYREALRLELADMSEGIDLKKLREIARTHIEKAAAGDMQAIKELADRLDGKPAQIPEHEFNNEGESVIKIAHEKLARPCPTIRGYGQLFRVCGEVQPANWLSRGCRESPRALGLPLRQKV